MIPGLGEFSETTPRPNRDPWFWNRFLSEHLDLNQKLKMEKSTDE